VHIPALRQISTQFQDIIDVLIIKFSYPVGIQDVGINYITGNLLIHYDHQSSSEKAILAWLSDLSMITERIWYQFRDAANGNADEISENLLQYFIEVSKNGNILDKNLIIPDYVWN
jgi:hypothetical protein